MSSQNTIKFRSRYETTIQSYKQTNRFTIKKKMFSFPDPVTTLNFVIFILSKVDQISTNQLPVLSWTPFLSYAIKWKTYNKPRVETRVHLTFQAAVFARRSMTGTWAFLYDLLSNRVITLHLFVVIDLFDQRMMDANPISVRFFKRNNFSHLSVPVCFSKIPLWQIPVF